MGLSLSTESDIAMNIIACMPVRNESWILHASICVALSWCDKIVILNHASTDDSAYIIAFWKFFQPDRVVVLNFDNPVWDEMDHRQYMLEVARQNGATHIALIDADEILTADLAESIRTRLESLVPGECLTVPMRPVWGSLDMWRNDQSVWSRAKITVGFADCQNLAYKPRDYGYQHHARNPHGKTRLIHHVVDGGVMHLQFADKRRITAKHAWYKMMERVRWPERDTALRIDQKYSQALDERKMNLTEIPESWWGHVPMIKGQIRLGETPWHEAECERLWAEYGPERFEGLNLYGLKEGKYHAPSTQ